MKAYKAYIVYPFKTGKSTEKLGIESLENLKFVPVEDDCLHIEVTGLKKEVYLHFSKIVKELFSSHWEEFSSNLENRPGDGHWFDDQFRTELLASKIKNNLRKKEICFLL